MKGLQYLKPGLLCRLVLMRLSPGMLGGFLVGVFHKVAHHLLIVLVWPKGFARKSRTRANMHACMHAGYCNGNTSHVHLRATILQLSFTSCMLHNIPYL